MRIFLILFFALMFAGHGIALAETKAEDGAKTEQTKAAGEKKDEKKKEEEPDCE